MTKVAAVQMTSGLEVPKNLQIASQLIQQAAEQGAKLVVLPENFSFMGADEKAKLKIAEKENAGHAQQFLADQALKHQLWIVGGTIPLQSEISGKVYNSCLLYNAKGEQVARYDKIHLFDVTVKPGLEIYEESASVTPGKNVVVTETPFGNLGLTVCYDIRFPELFRAMSAQGAEIFTIPAAFTVKTGEAHWKLLARARAVENFCYVIGACQTGTHDNGRKTYGHSLIVDPWGTVLSELSEGTGIILADVDLQKQKQIRQDFPSLNHRRI